ncbi:helix-turn-helix transcriptional regulator [Elizabethkingia anophelis]|uniref:helix-turn-helix transcriptional regulator n=1 Tax=Elizabethkingia anophelis TaxID=1117645 RepID=UPI003891294D
MNLNSNRKLDGDYVVKNKKIIDASIKIGYAKGETLGYIQIASALRLNNQYQECLKLLNTSEKKAKEINDEYTYGRLYLEYAQLYYYMGLAEIAIKYSDLAISYLSKVKPYPAYKKTMQFAYGCRAVYYEKKDPKESLHNLFKSVAYNPTPINTSNIALHYITNKKLDSAKYYLDKSSILLNNSKFQDKEYYITVVLLANAKLLIAQKKDNEAKKILMSALQNSERNSYKQLTLDIYQSMINIYQSNGNYKEEIEAKNKYKNLEDSIKKLQHNGITASIGNLLNDDMIKITNEEKEKHWTRIIFIGLICSIISFLIFYQYNRRNSRKIALQTERVSNVENDMISIDSQNQLITMAKENNPEFLLFFEKIHPEFCEKLNILDPSINREILKFCAFLKLGFTTKEIAEYTFLEVRSVQTKKSRLRKQLNIASNVDLNLYMAHLLDKEI